MADLFAELHRRHPDVDLVLLPPEPAPVEAPEAGPDEVAAVLTAVTTTAGRIWSAVAHDSTVAPQVRWSYAADPGRVRAVARVVEPQPDGFHVLVALRHELEQHGWAVARPPGAVERLTGHLDELTLTASYAEQTGVLLVTVSSDPVVVGAGRATALVRGEA
ncbi:MAG: hypothetical protein JWN84_400 [Nocardioides sp.]|jgi:hypothetical protein|nr:hypothetical protein [Nocardioides sp.]